MSLPVRADLTAYLRIEAEEAAAESALLDALLVRAQAMLEAWLGRPILARTFEDDTDEARPDDRPVTRLLANAYPLDAGSLTVTDADGTDVDATTYRVKALTGEIIGLAGVTFPNPPYTLAYDAGLELHPLYDDQIEPLVSAAILDIASDLYHARNPRAAGESAGGGASTTYANQALPERVQVALQPYRRLDFV